jgi:hypothetical protein
MLFQSPSASFSLKQVTHLVQRRLIRKRLVANLADHRPISSVRLQVSK